jgi:hypothetical protein
MTTNCNSSPKSGCEDSKTLDQLVSLLEMVETRLTTIIDKKIQIVIDLQNCAGANNEILDNIIDKYETIIVDDCCEETNINLQRIIDLLNGLIYGTSCQLDGVIECWVEPSTTEEPATTTAEPTTTEAVGENSGLFFVSNIEMFPCIETDLADENQLTLFYEGTFGTGSTMFTDTIDGTLLSGFLYIKKLGSLNVYDVGSESGVVGAITYTCE